MSAHRYVLSAPGCRECRRRRRNAQAVLLSSDPPSDIAVAIARYIRPGALRGAHGTLRVLCGRVRTQSFSVRSFSVPHPVIFGPPPWFCENNMLLRMFLRSIVKISKSVYNLYLLFYSKFQISQNYKSLFDLLSDLCENGRAHALARARFALRKNR